MCVCMCSSNPWRQMSLPAGDDATHNLGGQFLKRQQPAACSLGEKLGHSSGQHDQCDNCLRGRGGERERDTVESRDSRIVTDEL